MILSYLAERACGLIRAIEGKVLAAKPSKRTVKPLGESQGGGGGGRGGGGEFVRVKFIFIFEDCTLPDLTNRRK